MSKGFTEQDYTDFESAINKIDELIQRAIQEIRDVLVASGNPGGGGIVNIPNLSIEDPEVPAVCRRGLAILAIGLHRGSIEGQPESERLDALGHLFHFLAEARIDMVETKPGGESQLMLVGEIKDGLRDADTILKKYLKPVPVA
jgi:hypothetical protein